MRRSRKLLISGATVLGLLAISAPMAAALTTSTDETVGEGGADVGQPVYGPEEIDGWSTSSPEYGRLADSWAGNVNRPHTSYGTEISGTERDLLRDESGYAKVQAVLWAADGEGARRGKVVAMLDELGSVTSWQTDSAEQYRLVAGWSCTNLSQAAAIVGYTDTEFERFLVDECYPLLDWTNGGNWHASFADSRLAIAAYTADPELWEDATAYFYERIAQSIYHSEYDGSTVRPLLKSDGSPDVDLTKIHWGEHLGAGQIDDDLTPVDPSLFPDGVNAERTRDLAHVSMGLGAWMHGARTIITHGDELKPHAYDRLRAAYAHHGDRVLTYIETGTIPAPDVAKGDGGSAYRMAWFGARIVFGDDTPASVTKLCDHPQVTGSSAVGGNHLIAEAFTDNS